MSSENVRAEPRKRHTVLSSWTSGRPPDSVMDFRLTLDKVKRDRLRSMPIRTSEKVKASEAMLVKYDSAAIVSEKEVFADQDIREYQC